MRPTEGKGTALSNTSSTKHKKASTMKLVPTDTCLKDYTLHRRGTGGTQQMRMFDFSRLELRVWANSDSEMQRFESSGLNRPVSL
jgi:hypothetical protein